MEKQVKAVMLPTDIATSLWDCESDLCFDDKATLKSVDSIWIPQHIYITSDDEIKEGDWVLLNYPSGKEIKQMVEGVPFENAKCINSEELVHTCGHRKIIATSDKKFTTTDMNNPSKIGGFHYKELPQIPQSFQKAFVESGGKEDWEIEIDWSTEEFYTNNTPTEIKLDSDNCVILSAVECEAQQFLLKHYQLSMKLQAFTPGLVATIMMQFKDSIPVEEKMYSKKDMFNSYALGMGRAKLGDTNSDFFHKWIKENL